MVKIFKKLANYNFIIILFAAFLVFMLYLFPTHQAEISEIIEHKFISFDERFSYTQSDVLSTLEVIGKEGRKKYSFISGVIDMVYPIIYGLLFFLLLFKLINPIDNSKIKWILITPIIAVLFDYLENFSVLHLINIYPNISDSQVLFSSFCTSTKWILIAITLLLIINLIIFNLIKANREQCA